ncbi:MAG: SDR family NAD(P)-dependent oxidoreductase [Candidatus Rokubacteria bacterium]|nr:SDR family NAD(P)-dependent oxidoreductase [Candidatus Rokubacteria bacterium]
MHSAAFQNAERLYEARISRTTPGFLGDHRVFETPVVPATAFFEIALAAGVAIYTSDRVALTDVTIQRALILDDQEERILQCLLTPDVSLAHTFQIFSRRATPAETEPTWTLHAAGRVGAIDVAPDPDREDIRALQAAFTAPLDVDECYRRFSDQGIDYGPSFRAIAGLWTRGEEALGRVRLAEALGGDAEGFAMHPVALDACGQIVGAAFPPPDGDETFLPVGLERLEVHGRPGDRLWCLARVRAPQDGNQPTRTADLRLLDDTGAVIASVQGLVTRRASREAVLRSVQKDVAGWLYEVAWHPSPGRPSPAPGSGSAGNGPWVILHGRPELGRELASLLEERGERCVLVSAGDRAERTGPARYVIDPAKPADFQWLFADILGEPGPSVRGIVHLWTLDEIPAGETAQDARLPIALLGCGSVLHLVQAAARAGWTPSPRLWLVTEGAQAVGEGPVRAEQAPVWGLGRVVALEHPELRCVRVDLDPAAGADSARALLSEVWTPDAEDQIAHRRGVRHVARLVRRPPRPDRGERATHPRQARISRYGILDCLALEPMTRRPPARGEVEIEVRATGLNFRDVLNALGMLQEEAERLGIRSAAEMRFGFECAGLVVAVGEDVRRFRIGDEVIAAITTGSMGDFATVQAEFVAPKPPALSFAEAATLPLAFLTAHHALHGLAAIRPGDRVLIHAAAGGVGQAAMQLARRAGARVFATASPGKWDALRASGVEHVMHSRTLDFADEVMARTGGRGVDVVLNSLNGDFIPKSLAALAPRGRFVEIGKLGVWDAARVSELRPDVSYFQFDLGDVARQTPGVIAEMLAALLRDIGLGHLRPLPHTVFPIEEVAHAFRHMAQARHVGKIVIAQPEATAARGSSGPVVRGDASYLVTGGLGALGIEVARWLVARGARQLVLAGRREPSPLARASIREFEEAGADVLVLSADVSRADDVARVLERLESRPALRGIVHAAGVLDDGILLQHTWDRFQGVLAPKVAGAFNLHAATRSMPLDFFVCFSSSAAVLGSSGQGPYAAANAFMDALAHARRMAGLTGLSINWGPWAEVGMAAAMRTRDRRRLVELGWEPMLPEQGLRALDAALSHGAAQVVVLPLEWPRFLAQFRGAGAPPLFALWAGPALGEGRAPPGAAAGRSFLERLQEASASERWDLMLGYLRQRLARVLGLGPSERLDAQQLLNELGLDSLMGMELRNWLLTDLGVSVPVEKLIDRTPLADLVTSLLAEVTLARVILQEQPATGPGDDMDEITL